mgnify:FL=1
MSLTHRSISGRIDETVKTNRLMCPDIYYFFDIFFFGGITGNIT